MNRVDFMSQLERLLQSIAPGEREEALQYYNDYFDDAGKENEQEVIEALGNPARVAENIKRDLLGNGYGGGPLPKAQPSDRALVEYGREAACGEEASAGSAGPDAGESRSTDFTGGAGKTESADWNGAGGQGSAERNGKTESADWSGGAGGQESMNWSGGAGRQESMNWSGGAGGQESMNWNGGANGAEGASWNDAGAYGMPPEKAGMPAWAIALLVTLLVLAFPVLLGLLAALFGVIVCWYALIFSAGAVAVSLLLMLLVLVITGLICFPTNPWVGMAMVGGGLICGGIGMLFLMLTVAMAGIVTPAIWRGIRCLFGKKKKMSMRARAYREV